MLDEPALVARCRDNSASYKAPWKVVFVDTLPTNAGGNVQKFLR
jgi:acyl-CoA synthetase (AMP-forming)/AMP-acid ligase II